MHGKRNSASGGSAGEAAQPCHVGFLVDGEKCEGHSYSFSENGMLVLCKTPAKLHTRLTLSLEFPNSHAILEVQGEVVWTNRHGPSDKISPRGMGIKFINADPLIMRVIGQFATQYGEAANRYACYYS
jgi:Tfp pilus assembly protein PilZ